MKLPLACRILKMPVLAPNRFGKLLLPKRWHYHRFCIYYIRYSTWKGCRLYLEDLIVTEQYRGKGIGKLLFDRLILETKERGYSGMVWQVLDWNEPAINFYKKYECQY
jgi:GNAT superfamily N-acetyltransferase